MDVVEEDDLEFSDNNTFIKIDEQFKDSVNISKTSSSELVNSANQRYRTSGGGRMYGASYTEVLLGRPTDTDEAEF
jgi:hypothetical protein